MKYRLSLCFVLGNSERYYDGLKHLNIECLKAIEKCNLITSLWSLLPINITGIRLEASSRSSQEESIQKG